MLTAPLWTNPEKIKKILGIDVVIGFMKANLAAIYWSKNSLYNFLLLRTIVSRNRFELLYSNILIRLLLVMIVLEKYFHFSTDYKNSITKYSRLRKHYHWWNNIYQTKNINAGSSYSSYVQAKNILYMVNENLFWNFS